MELAVLLDRWCSGESTSELRHREYAFGDLLLTSLCRSQDSPGYKPGLWACITSSLIIIVVVCMLDTYFWFANKKQARGELVIEGADDGFRYTL